MVGKGELRVGRWDRRKRGAESGMRCAVKAPRAGARVERR